jgi:hypothetical protein
VAGKWGDLRVSVSAVVVGELGGMLREPCHDSRDTRNGRRRDGTPATVILRDDELIH